MEVRLPNGLAKAANKIKERAVPRVEQARQSLQKVTERAKGLDPRSAIMRAFRHDGARATKPNTAGMFPPDTGESLLKVVAAGGEVAGGQSTSLTVEQKIAQGQPIASPPDAKEAFGRIVESTGGDRSAVDSATFGGRPSTEIATSPGSAQATESAGSDGQVSVSQEQIQAQRVSSTEATTPVIPVTTEQANLQQITAAQGEKGDAGNGSDEATAKAILDHVNEIQQQAQQKTLEQAADPMAAMHEQIRTGYTEPAIQRKTAEKQVRDAALQRYNDLAADRAKLVQTNWEQDAPSKIPDFVLKTPEEQRAAIEELKTKALKANAEAEIAFVKSELKTAEGKVRVEAAIKAGDKNIEEAREIAMLELAAEQAQAEATAGGTENNQTAASAFGDQQNVDTQSSTTADQQESSKEVVATTDKKRIEERETSQKQLDDIRGEIKKVEAFIEAARAEQRINSEAEKRLDELRKKAGLLELEVDDSKLARAASDRLSKGQRDGQGKTHRGLEERFTDESGLRGLVKNHYLKNARVEVGKMLATLSTIDPEALDSKQHKALMEAYQNGPEETVQYEHHMGFILKNIRNKHTPLANKIPFIKRFAKPLDSATEREIALLQAEALSGDEEVLRKYNRSLFRLFRELLFTIFLSAVVSGKDAMSDSIAVSAPGH